jgi:hypothetical protein
VLAALKERIAESLLPHCGSDEATNMPDVNPGIKNCEHCRVSKGSFLVRSLLMTLFISVLEGDSVADRIAGNGVGSCFPDTK